MNDENKKEIKIVPTVIPKQINIKPVPIPTKPNTKVEPKVMPTPGKVIKPTPLVNKETPIENKVIKPTPAVNIKPVEEKVIVKEEPKVEIKEEVKENKAIANPNPMFTPKNAFAPPDTKDQDKLFEETVNAYQNTLNTKEENNIQDDSIELLHAFIGKNSEKIIKRTFSIPGFFFGVLYLFYRKLFIYGLFIVLIQALTTLLLPEYITNMPYLNLIPNLLIAAFFNRIYLNNANKKINNIKGNNLHASLDDLKVKCAKEGGTSIGNIFLGIFTSTLIVLLLSILAFGFTIKRIINIIKDPSLLLTDAELDDELPQGKTYDGIIIYDTSKKMTDIFKITIPKVFKEYEDNFEYSYTAGKGVFNKCEFRLSALKIYNDAEKLIKEMKEYYNNSKVSDYHKERINNIDWHWISIESSTSKTYYYATLYEKRVFLFEYKVGKDTDNNCDPYKDVVLKSTSFR